MCFDEVVFEEERFFFAFDEDAGDGGDLLHHRACFEVEFFFFLEVGGDAFFEVFGFADVDGLSEPILHEIDARLVREASHFFFQLSLIRLWHLLQIGVG